MCEGFLQRTTRATKIYEEGVNGALQVAGSLRRVQQQLIVGNYEDRKWQD